MSLLRYTSLLILFLSNLTFSNDSNNPFLASYSISVTASGSSNYTLSGTDLNGSVSGDDPALTFIVGDAITFSVNASGHPFYIKTQAGTGTDNQASGVTNNGAESGDVVWTPTASGTYYYQCSAHAGMVGTITVKAKVSSISLDETIKKSLKYAKSKKIKFNYVFQISYKTPFLKSNDLDSFVYMMEFFKTDEVLGIHMIGARCADLIAEGVTAMEFRASAEDIARMSHAHPTYAEAVKEAALAASENRALHM